ncbi:hypothetical protein D1872_288500 [compost metagenome]
MCRHQDGRFFSAEFLQDRDRQRDSFSRVRAGRQFVDQQERRRAGDFQHRHQALNLRGEGAKRLLQVLPVPDYRHDAAVNGKLAAGAYRYKQAGLHH